MKTFAAAVLFTMLTASLCHCEDIHLSNGKVYYGAVIHFVNSDGSGLNVKTSSGNIVRLKWTDIAVGDRDRLIALAHKHLEAVKKQQEREAEIANRVQQIKEAEARAQVLELLKERQAERDAITEANQQRKQEKELERAKAEASWARIQAQQAREEADRQRAEAERARWDAEREAQRARMGFN